MLEHKIGDGNKTIVCFLQAKLASQFSKNDVALCMVFYLVFYPWAAQVMTIGFLYHLFEYANMTLPTSPRASI